MVDSDGDGGVSSGELELDQRVHGESRSLESPDGAMDADYRCSPDELTLARSRYGRQHPIVSVIDLLPRSYGRQHPVESVIDPLPQRGGDR